MSAAYHHERGPLQVAQLVGGVLALAAAVLCIWQQEGVAEASAEWKRLRYDRRVTLLDPDRAERLQQAFQSGSLDRALAGAGAAFLLFLGTILIWNAVG